MDGVKPQTSNHEVVSGINEKLYSSMQKIVPTSSDAGTVTPKAPKLAWQEQLSESSVDQIEEGTLHEMEELKSSGNKPNWREFTSYPGVNVSDVNVTLPQRRSYDALQTNNHDCRQFLSRSQLFHDEGQKSHISSTVTTDDAMITGQGMCQDEELKTSQWTTLIIKPPTTDGGFIDEVSPPEQLSTTHDRQATLPIRPLTIGDNETIGATLVYRPLSPFDPDLYPSRTSSTPVIPSQPPMYTGSGVDTDVRDMSARERLQPLGRDGLEVKQGPPWGLSIPMFQPHSRNSSMSSSSDSASSSNNANFVRLQLMTPKTDVEVLVADTQLSRKSSLRSLESKEPLPAVKMMMSGLDTTTPKTQIGRFHEIHPNNTDTESPVSKILGPTFKTTQKRLQDLQRRPLADYQDEQPPLGDEVLKIPAERKLDDVVDDLAEGGHRGALVQNNQDDTPESKISEKDSLYDSFSNWRQSRHLTPKRDSLVETDQVVDQISRTSESRDSHHSLDDGEYRLRSEVIGGMSNSEMASTGELVKESMIKEDNHSLKENIHDIVDDGVRRVSLSWDNILEDRPSSDAVNDELVSEFDRVASQSISLSNAVATSLREELNRTFDLLEVESPDEGTLTDNEGPMLDSGLSETTTNEDLFLPKGLEPLTRQHGPVGIYDVRTSCGPGSTNRKRHALGQLGDHNAPVDVSGVYVSEGTTEPSGEEDKGIGSQPDGQSTPKSDEGSKVGNNEYTRDHIVNSWNNEYTRDPGMSNRKYDEGSMVNSGNNEYTRDRMMNIGNNEYTKDPGISNRKYDEGSMVNSGNNEYTRDRMMNIGNNEYTSDRMMNSGNNGYTRDHSMHSNKEYDKGSMINSGNNEYMGDGVMNIGNNEYAKDHSKPGEMADVQTSTDYTWSVKTPVMSQLNTKPLMVKQRKSHVLNEKETSRDRKRVSRHKDTYNNMKTRRPVEASENTSSGYSYQEKRDGGRRTKKSVADVILENFRREEKEDKKKRQRRMMELKQTQSSTDLNELWERFQYIIGKNSRNSKKHSSLRTPPSVQFSTPTDPDNTESTLRDQTPVTTDSDEEFAKFIRRVRQVPSSNSGSSSCRSGYDRRYKEHDHTPRGIVLHRHDTSDTSGKGSASPLSIPMMLGMRRQHSKKTLGNGCSVCTCGGRIDKGNSVRDVGVNCPTPPLTNFPRPSVVVNALRPPVEISNFARPPVVVNAPRSPVEIFNFARPPVVNNDEVNVVNFARVAENVASNVVPSSLVKLSLQDAFMYSNQDFIERSRQRVLLIKEKRKENNRGVPVVVPTGRTKKVKEVLNTVVDKPVKIYDPLVQKKPRRMTQKEIRNVNKRMYKNLPEVKKRKEEERLASLHQTNRLRAQLYGKHVRNLNRMYTGP